MEVVTPSPNKKPVWGLGLILFLPLPLVCVCFFFFLLFFFGEGLSSPLPNSSAASSVLLTLQCSTGATLSKNRKVLRHVKFLLLS